MDKNILNSVIGDLDRMDDNELESKYINAKENPVIGRCFHDKEINNPYWITKSIDTGCTPVSARNEAGTLVYRY